MEPPTHDGAAAQSLTMGPRMMALPCPAKPKDTALTPSYSTGVMACGGGWWWSGGDDWVVLDAQHQ